jgi:hypothetical protein
MFCEKFLSTLKVAICDQCFISNICIFAGHFICGWRGVIFQDSFKCWRAGLGNQFSGLCRDRFLSDLMGFGKGGDVRFAKCFQVDCGFSVDSFFGCNGFALDV